MNKTRRDALAIAIGGAALATLPALARVGKPIAAQIVTEAAEIRSGGYVYVTGVIKLHEFTDEPYLTFVIDTERGCTDVTERCKLSGESYVHKFTWPRHDYY